MGFDDTRKLIRGPRDVVIYYHIVVGVRNLELRNGPVESPLYLLGRLAPSTLETSPKLDEGWWRDEHEHG